MLLLQPSKCGYDLDLILSNLKFEHLSLCHLNNKCDLTYGVNESHPIFTTFNPILEKHSKAGVPICLGFSSAIRHYYAGDTYHHRFFSLESLK